MTGQKSILPTVGAYNGLEVEYQARGPMVYVRDPDDAANGFIRVSVGRWTRFIAAIKADAFTPQQEGEEVTVTIGDMAHFGIVQFSSHLVTTPNTWEIFTKAVKGGEFDHIVPLNAGSSSMPRIR